MSSKVHFRSSISLNFHDFSTTSTNKKGALRAQADTARHGVVRFELRGVKIDRLGLLHVGAGHLVDMDKAVLATRNQILSLSEQSVHAALVSRGSLGQVAPTPLDDVARVGPGKERVANPSLAEHRLGTLVAPSGALLRLERSIGPSDEADFLDACGHGCSSSWVEAEAENFGTSALSVSERSDGLAWLRGRLFPLKDCGHLVVIHGGGDDVLSIG